MLLYFIEINGLFCHVTKIEILIKKQQQQSNVNNWKKIFNS